MYTMLTCLLLRSYDPARLLAEHPPKLRHPHKRMVFELACPANARHVGPISVTRWRAAPLPPAVRERRTTAICERGTYGYDGAPSTWHVNFADPQLFVAYGSALLAQDELQAAEHPLLGSIREALGDDARTEDSLAPTPVLVAGVERRCAIDTRELYGNRFARASVDEVRRAITVLEPPPRSNLIAIAAPGGGRGPYFRAQIEKILVTAYTGFAAAVGETGGLVEVRTGFWGCGAFGGNRQLMAILQLVAAELAGVERVRFYAFDAAGERDFAAGAAALERVRGTAGEPVDALVERIADLDYEWGVSDGN